MARAPPVPHGSGSSTGAPTAAQQRGLQPVDRRPHVEQRVVGQRVPVGGVGDEVVAERHARAEHAEQPRPQALAAADRRPQRVGVVDGGEQPGQGRDGEVRVGCVGRGGHERAAVLVDRPAVAPDAERDERGLGGGGVLEAQPHQQPGARAALGEDGHSGSS